MLVLLVSGWVAAVTPIDLSFAGLMDRSHPEMQRYFEASRRYGLGGRLPLLLERQGDDAQLDPLVEKLRAQLGDDPRIRSVTTPFEPSTDAEGSAWLLPDAVFDRFAAWVEQPRDSARAEALRAALQSAEPVPDPDARLLLITLQTDSFEQDLDAQDFPAIDARVQALAAEHGVRARFAGMPAIVEQDQATTLGRVGVMTPLSLVLALVLLLGLERRPFGLMAIALPMLAAASSTVAIMGLAFGRITLMESLFGVLVFGLGVDFALHLGLRAARETEAGADLPQAIEIAFSRTGPGVVVGALTTAGAFGLLALAPDPTFVHLGASGAIGITLCLLGMLTVLPAAWAGLGAVPRGAGGREGGALAKVVGALSRSATRHPRLHVVVMAAALLLAGLGLPRLRFETDLNRVVNRELSAVTAAAAMHERFGVHPMPWVLHASDIEEARRLHAALADLELVGRTESIATNWPRDLEERRRWFQEHGARLAAMPSVPAELQSLVEAARAAVNEPPPTPADLPAAVRGQLVADDGTLLVLAFPATPHMDARQAARERQAVRELDPQATSMAVVIELVVAPERPFVVPVALAVLVFVVVVLVVDLRRPGAIALAVVPVACGSVVAFGILGWASIPINLVTAMAAPLVIGLGVDDGIHVVHRLHEAKTDADAVATACAAVSRAIALTTATTCVSVSTLLLSGHPGLESMAWIMLLALPLCLLASASTLPALATLSRTRAHG